MEPMLEELEFLQDQKSVCLRTHMCLRCVMEHMLPVEEFADKLVTQGCLKQPDYRSVSTSIWTLCVFLSQSVSVCLSVCLCLCLYLSHSFSVSLCVSLCLSLCLCLCLWLSVSVSLCVSVSLSLFALTDSTSMVEWAFKTKPLYLSVCLPACLCLSVCLSCPDITVMIGCSNQLSVYLPACLCLSLSVSVSVSLCLCLSCPDITVIIVWAFKTSSVCLSLALI